MAALVPNLRIFIFALKFANSRALISNITTVFQNCCPKHPDKVLLGIFIFALNFEFSKIQGYFKYDTSFF